MLETLPLPYMLHIDLKILKILLASYYYQKYYNNICILFSKGVMLILKCTSNKKKPLRFTK